MLKRLLVCLFALPAFTANAVIITGSFSGYLDHGNWYGYKPVSGSPTTGSFFIDTTRFDDSGVYWNLEPDAIGFSITHTASRGNTVEYSVGSQHLAITRSAGADSLVATTYVPHGYGAELHLFGDLFAPNWTDPHSPTLDLDSSFLYTGYIRHDSFLSTYYAFTTVSLTWPPGKSPHPHRWRYWGWPWG